MQFSENSCRNKNYGVYLNSTGQGYGVIFSNNQFRSAFTGDTYITGAGTPPTTGALGQGWICTENVASQAAGIPGGWGNGAAGFSTTWDRAVGNQD